MAVSSYICQPNHAWHSYADFMLINLLKLTRILDYHQLFYSLRPRMVIELSACEGGSAIILLWFGDQIKLLGIEGGHVYYSWILIPHCSAKGPRNWIQTMWLSWQVIAMKYRRPSFQKCYIKIATSMGSNWFRRCTHLI